MDPVVTNAICALAGAAAGYAANWWQNNRKNVDSGHDEDGNPDYYEGDVVQGDGKDVRDAHFERLWPKVNGLVSVPYTIPSYFPQSSRHDLANVITEFEEKTCVR